MLKYSWKNIPMETFPAIRILTLMQAHQTVPKKLTFRF